MSMDQCAVGFIGLGNMGRPMAENLLRAGYPVWVYDVLDAKTDPLVAAGAYRAATFAEAVRAADVVITMVRNDAELTRATLDANGILKRLRPGAIHLSTCTVGPGTLAQLAVAYRPLLEVLGRVTDYGELPERAAYAKLACNYLLAAGMAVMGEAAALAQACGIDPVHLLGMLADSRSFVRGLGGYAEKIVRDDHDEVRFPVPMGQKDMGLVLAAAKGAGVSMPIADTVLELLNEAASLGWADRDWSVLARVPAAEAGLLVERAA